MKISTAPPSGSLLVAPAGSEPLLGIAVPSYAKLGVERAEPYMENVSIARLHVLTIGHSNHQIGHFLDLLKSHSVQIVADTRSQPYTEYASHFNKIPRKKPLESQRIRAESLG